MSSRIVALRVRMVAGPSLAGLSRLESGLCGLDAGLALADFRNFSAEAGIVHLGVVRNSFFHVLLHVVCPMICL